MSAKWFVTGALAVLVLTCRGAAQSVPELLNKGIYTQETVGDLDRAIEIYRQILSFAPADRTYAAQTQYRLAQCLLQKGAKADAAREFKKVIEGYPEEKDLVERARESLIPLARFVDADYYDPVLGLSFSSPTWLPGEHRRLEEGWTSVWLGGPGSDRNAPIGVGLMEFRRSKTAAPDTNLNTRDKPQALEDHMKLRCPSCRFSSMREVKGRQVLVMVHDYNGPPYAGWGDTSVPKIACFMLMDSGKTQVVLRVDAPTKDLERNQAIMERILESVRMP